MFGFLAGFSSFILVMLFGQSRVFFSMSRDGLVPQVFSDVHPRYRTPYKSNMLFFVFTGLLAAFVPADVTGEMTSIGTLLLSSSSAQVSGSCGFAALSWNADFGCRQHPLS